MRISGKIPSANGGTDFGARCSHAHLVKIVGPGCAEVNVKIEFDFHGNRL